MNEFKGLITKLKNQRFLNYNYILKLTNIIIEMYKIN